MKLFRLASVLAVAVMIFWIFRTTRPMTSANQKKAGRAGERAASLDPGGGLMRERVQVTARSPIPAASTLVSTGPVAVVPRVGDPSTQHVFRLMLDGNRCALEAIEEVRGNFGRRRLLAWHPGMLCCRLIDAEGRLIGEQTVEAPDEVCVVLDPEVVGGPPGPVHFTREGTTIFQVGFPEIAKAVKLNIFRITEATRPNEPSTPVGDLLAAIPIPSQ